MNGEIQILPPGPEPKKETAHYRPHHLHEHLLAFLNANNPRIFKQDNAQEEWTPHEVVFSLPDVTLREVMEKVINFDYLRPDHLKHYGKKLKKASGKYLLHPDEKEEAGGKRKHKFAIPNKIAYDIVAALFGYSSYSEAYEQRTTLSGGRVEVIINRNDKEKLKAELGI